MFTRSKNRIKNFFWCGRKFSHKFLVPSKMRERDFIKENSVLANFTPAIMKNSAVRIGPCIPPSTTNFTRKKFTSKKTASASKNL